MVHNTNLYHIWSTNGLLILVQSGNVVEMRMEYTWLCLVVIGDRTCMIGWETSFGHINDELI